MKVLDILKKVRFHDLWKLAILSLKNPWFIWPTIAATKETMSVSDHYFGNLHHQNGPATSVFPSFKQGPSSVHRRVSDYQHPHAPDGLHRLSGPDVTEREQLQL